MEIVKTFGDIRRSDIVRRQLEGAQELVLSVRAFGTHVCLKLSSPDGVERQYQAASDLPVILVYRPWPEGMTEPDMLAHIALRAHDVHMRRGYTASAARKEWRDSLKRAVTRLLEAIEAYELGKPQEVEP